MLSPFMFPKQPCNIALLQLQIDKTLPYLRVFGKGHDLITVSRARSKGHQML